MIIKKHLIISGKVQGVGFRYWMQNLAINNNIGGWVKNKSSGDVEALIIGQEKEKIRKISKAFRETKKTSIEAITKRIRAYYINTD